MSLDTAWSDDIESIVCKNLGWKNMHISNEQNMFFIPKNGKTISSLLGLSCLILWKFIFGHLNWMRFWRIAWNFGDFRIKSDFKILYFANIVILELIQTSVHKSENFRLFWPFLSCLWSILESLATKKALIC